MVFGRYGYRQERSDYRESLKTIVFVHENSFRTCINKLGVVFLGYDYRCKQFVWRDPCTKTLWFIQERT